MTGRNRDERINDLDVVRGLALCGIHVVNIYQQVVLPKEFPEGVGYGLGELPLLVRYGFYERFLPVFTLLFGISFGIFLLRAAARTDHPRRVLVRRLLVLLVVGLLHQLVHPGEVLSVYAVMGLVILLPASFLGGAAACGLGVVLLLAGGQLVPGYGVMPGLLVLGYGLAVLRVPEGLARHTGRVALAFALLAGLTALHWWSVSAGVRLPTVSLGQTSLTSQLAGVCTGLAYATGTVLLLRTPLAGLLQAVLAPMGRMALTNYLAATGLFLGLSPVLGIDGLEDATMVWVLTGGIVVLEAIWSAYWLRRCRYGPAEWVWRCLTWGERVPLRRCAPGRDEVTAVGEIAAPLGTAIYPTCHGRDPATGARDDGRPGWPCDPDPVMADVRSLSPLGASARGGNGSPA